MDEKKELTRGEQLRRALTYQKKNGYDRLQTGELEAIEAYCSGYKQFLDGGKTERECVDRTIALAETAGFRPYVRGMELKPGDKAVSYTHLDVYKRQDVVTAGLDTVGMRCPAHALCRAILRDADVPVAAPSGNTSGRPSPTSAAHMWEDMDGKIDAIVDGGPCAVGVESTIVDLSCDSPRLLRPGGVTLEQLEAVLGDVEVDPAVTRLMGAGEKPRAPGMKYRHYAPKAPVTVVAGEPSKSAGYILDHAAPEDGIICFDEFVPLFTKRHEMRPVMNLGPSADKAEQARHIFDALRSFDHTAVKAIWAQCPDAAGIGLAIANRLNKAAGFHIIEV